MFKPLIWIVKYLQSVPWITLFQTTLNIYKQANFGTRTDLKVSPLSTFFEALTNASE